MSISAVGGSSGSAYAAKMTAKLMKKIDTDGDGSITKTEMAAFAQQQSGSGLDVNKLFAKADSDGNGSISSSELSSAIEKVGKHMRTHGGEQPLNPTDMAKSMISKLDTDGNGTLSQSELEAMKNANGKGPSATDIMKESDANSDGQLTVDELAAGMAKHAPKGPPPQDGSAGSSVISGTSASQSKYDTAIALLKALQESDNSDTSSSSSSSSANNIFSKLLTQIQNGASYSSEGTMSAGTASSLVNVQA